MKNSKKRTKSSAANFVCIHRVQKLRYFRAMIKNNQRRIPNHQEKSLVEDYIFVSGNMLIVACTFS